MLSGLKLRYVHVRGCKAWYARNVGVRLIVISAVLLRAARVRPPAKPAGEAWVVAAAATHMGTRLARGTRGPVPVQIHAGDPLDDVNVDEIFRACPNMLELRLAGVPVGEAHASVTRTKAWCFLPLVGRVNYW